MERREFLKLFSLSALALIAPLDKIGAINDQRYSSEVFGVSFRIPQGWHTLTPEQYLKVHCDLYGEDARKLQVPIVYVCMLPEPTPKINPTFEILADRKRKWMGDDLVREQRKIFSPLPKGVDEFRFETEICEVQNFGCTTAYSLSSYKVSTLTGKSYMFYHEVYSLYHRDSYFQITFSGDHRDRSLASSEFEQIRQTLHFW